MAEISPAVLERLADAHQRSLSRIQTAAEYAAQSVWYSMNPNPDNTDEMAQWASAFWNVTQPAVEAINAETHAYMSAINAYLGVGAVLAIPNTSWFRKDFEGWAISPFTFARTADVEAPILATGPHIRKLVSSVTRMSEQEAFNQIVDSPEWELTWEYVEERPVVPIIAPTVNDVPLSRDQALEQGYELTQRNRSAKRWKRVTQAGACGWCEVVAGNVYSDQTRFGRSRQWHTFCHCSWVRLTPDQARKWESPVQEDWRDKIDRRSDPDAYEKQMLETQGG